MRLINALTLQLEEFSSETLEYSYSPILGVMMKSLPRLERFETSSEESVFAKIEGSCQQSLKDSIGHVWVDTNCIDKTSSSELSGAINSIFSWCRDSKIAMFI